MVHATRSSVALQNQHTSSEPQRSSTKKQGKKRKRTVAAGDAEEHRTAKQPRVEPKREEGEPGAGDMPLNSGDAVKILDVLEMIDTQGLLDRVFPLPESDSASSSEASTSKDAIKMYSLRALLKDSTSHPLRVLRSAIQPLFPISSHPRSRPSAPAAQQQHFCNLALSLLDQSSRNQPILSLSETTLFPDSETDSSPSGSFEQRRKYALVQRLPAGEWWSSTNTGREGEYGLTASEVQEMKKGQAELVAIIPSLPSPASSMPTLGELQMEGRREPRHRFKPLYMTSRTLSTGTFLDYGPHTSFAPPFDSEGAEVGREGLGRLLMGKLTRNKVREARRKVVARLLAEQKADVQTKDAAEPGLSHEPQDGSEIDALLERLFPGEKFDGFKAALQKLELEDAVTGLLKKNASALERLSLLQTIRLRAGSTAADENSEEWRTARETLNSLILLMSLRPRSSTTYLDTGDSHSPLIPSTTTLRRLHATLPASSSSGWQGTLDELRKAALRDDTTVHVKAGATTNTQYHPTTAYNYQGQNSAATTRPSTQPSAQGSYYQNAYAHTGATASAPVAYQYSGQYSYPPGTWYSYQQPGQKGNTAAIPYYANYMPQTGVGATTTPRAVGNTAKSQQGQNGWTHTYSQVQSQNQAAATLPPHLRRTATATPTQTPTQYHTYVPPAQTPGR